MHLGLKHLALIAFLLGGTHPWSNAAERAPAQMTDQENEISEEEAGDEDAAVEEDTKAADAEVAAPESETPPEAEEEQPAPVAEEETETEEESSPYASADTYSDSDDEVISYLMPYRNRRTSWGSLVSISYSGYSPNDYDPSFVLDSFDTYYGGAELPLVELTISPKKNFSLLSIALDIGVGYYDNKAPDSSQLTLIPARLGLGVALDTLFEEPYVVPYGSFGIYTMLYKETIGTQSVTGNTLMGFYYSAGLRFQLDWVDSDGDLASYDENGMENTFLFIEARSFLLPSEAVPDFGSPEDQPIALGGGFTVEF